MPCKDGQISLQIISYFNGTISSQYCKAGEIIAFLFFWLL